MSFFFFWPGSKYDPNDLNEYEETIYFWVDQYGGNNIITEDGNYFVFYN